MKIVGIAGSLRAGSYNRALIAAFQAAAPADTEFIVADISELPLFNQDVEASAFPPAATALKAAIESADALVIATPEYNRSLPGVLKNAIDWASRPYGQNSFAGKPVLVVGASIGSLATALAQYDLKKVLLYLDARVVGQPEFYVGNAASKFDAAGALTDADTKQHIEAALATLLTAVQK